MALRPPKSLDSRCVCPRILVRCTFCVPETLACSRRHTSPTWPPTSSTPCIGSQCAFERFCRSDGDLSILLPFLFCISFFMPDALRPPWQLRHISYLFFFICLHDVMTSGFGHVPLLAPSGVLLLACVHSSSNRTPAALYARALAPPQHTCPAAIAQSLCGAP